MRLLFGLAIELDLGLNAILEQLVQLIAGMILERKVVVQFIDTGALQAPQMLQCSRFTIGMQTVQQRLLCVSLHLGQRRYARLGRKYKRLEH